MALKIQRNEVWIKHIVNNLSNDNPKNTVIYREFTIFVDGSIESLNKIEYVEYHLPHTFPKPEIRTYESWDKFSYKAFAYQSFELQYTMMPRKHRQIDPGYNGVYFIDIEKSNERGLSVSIP